MQPQQQHIWKVGNGGFFGTIGIEPIVTKQPGSPDGELYLLRRERPLVSVKHLYVHPVMRGQGWAQALLNAVIRWADRNGIDIALYVYAYSDGKKLSNKGLVEFYKRFGFRLAPHPSYRAPRMVRRAVSG